MNATCRKFVLALALSMLPLQGIAATLSVLLCHGETQLHASHVDGGQDHGLHHDARHNEPPDDDDNNAAFHLCCNLTLSATLSLAEQAASPEFMARSIAPDLLPDLFVPERLHRPPLA